MSFWAKEVLAVVLLACSLARGGPEDDMANGQSSFRAVGAPYSESFPVRQVKGARVVLFNQKVADSLGLTLKDSQAIEKFLLENFAVTTEGAQGSPRTFFATRYLDYDRATAIRLGHPEGDGRVGWSGELKIHLPDGRIIYLDVTVKGVGRTPLAREARRQTWFSSSNAQYSDGLQTMEEAVRSFVHTQALHENGFDVPVDLAVIELPLEKENPGTKIMEKAAISIRVGTQTRPAQLRYFEKSPEEQRRLLDYIVRRDLGLPEAAPVGRIEIEKFLQQFARNLATEAARYADLEFVHGSPTAGNHTTAGASLDFGTFFTMDAFHGAVKYLYGQVKVSDQTDDIKHHIGYLLTYLAGDERVFPNDRLALEKRFDKRFQETLMGLRLARLGLSKEEIGSLPESLKKEFYEATTAIRNAKGTRKVSLRWGQSVPAAFDLREILKNSFHVLLSSKAARPALWAGFLTPKSWGTLTASDLGPQSKHGPIVEAYLATVQKIHDHLENSGADLAQVTRRAVEYARPRTDSLDYEMRELISKVRDPSRGFQANTERAMQLSQSLVDGKRIAEEKKTAPICREYSQLAAASTKLH